MLCRLGAVAKTAVVAFATFLALGGAKAGTIVDQGLTLYDANTGLEWLDVSATNGRPYSDVLANLNNPTDVVFGYRSATQLEVAQLFTDAGIIGVPCMSDCSAAVGQLIDMLGATFVTPTYEYIKGFIAEPNGSYQSYALLQYEFAGGGIYNDDAGYLIGYIDQARVGTFLVREIPLPGSFVLFGSGLLALFFVLRRKLVLSLPSKQHSTTQRHSPKSA